jgi:hypothetical protein
MGSMPLGPAGDDADMSYPTPIGQLRDEYRCKTTAAPTGNGANCSSSTNPQSISPALTA